MKAITTSELLATIDEARAMAGITLREIPKGFFTLEQYAERAALTVPGASAQLRKLVVAGKLEMVKVVCEMNGGGLRQRNAYGFPRRDTRGRRPGPNAPDLRLDAGSTKKSLQKGENRAKISRNA